MCTLPPSQAPCRGCSAKPPHGQHSGRKAERKSALDRKAFLSCTLDVLSGPFTARVNSLAYIKSPKNPSFQVLLELLLNFDRGAHPLQSTRFPSLFEHRVSAHSAALCGWLCNQGGRSRLHDLTVCTIENKGQPFPTRHNISV